MNTHGTTYYIIRGIIRFAFYSLLVAGVVIGIPLAVGAVWPALILAAGLTASYVFLELKARKGGVTSVAS